MMGRKVPNTRMLAFKMQTEFRSMRVMEVLEMIVTHFQCMQFFVLGLNQSLVPDVGFRSRPDAEHRNHISVRDVERC
jgi:hypothetical protein